jgi:hypothetical protein
MDLSGQLFGESLGDRVEPVPVLPSGRNGQAGLRGDTNPAAPFTRERGGKDYGGSRAHVADTSAQ